jgi:hypothetical protein
LTVTPAAVPVGQEVTLRAGATPWDGGEGCRYFIACTNGAVSGLRTGAKAVVNSFVSVASLGYVNEVIPVTAEDRANGYNTAVVFGRIGWTALFAAAGLGLADADVCLSNACFAAGTPLLTPDGAKPIEQFKVGDLVLSAPEDDPDGPVAPRRVEKVFQRLARIVELRVGGQTIRTTHEHPFYVQGKGWEKAAALSAGDLLKSRDGSWTAVESLNDTNQDTTVYNLRIEEYHTYFVGCAEWGFSIWAHNAFYSSPLLNEMNEFMGPEIEQLAEDVETFRESVYEAEALGQDALAETLQDTQEILSQELEDAKWIMNFFEEVLNMG